MEAQEKGSCRGGPTGTPSTQRVTMITYFPTTTYGAGFIVQFRDCTLARCAPTHASDQCNGVSCGAHTATGIIASVQSAPDLTVVD